jgi:hypothetical protein
MPADVSARAQSRFPAYARRTTPALSPARHRTFSQQVANQAHLHRPVSIRLPAYDDDLRYLELIMCQLSGSNVSTPSDRRADPALTPNAGLAAITELCGRLGVIGALDAAVGPIKQRDRGFGAGELLAGLAVAQLAGEDFLTGLDRQHADAGQQITPVPGLASTTAAGLARRVVPGQWRAVEAGLAAVTGRMLALLPAPRADALTGGPVIIDLDTTDVEVYGRKKRGVAYNHQGQRVGRPHLASWAEAEIVLAADLGDGTDGPIAEARAVIEHWEGSRERVDSLTKADVRTVLDEAADLMQLVDSSDRPERDTHYRPLSLSHVYETEAAAGRELVRAGRSCVVAGARFNL